MNLVRNQEIGLIMAFLLIDEDERRNGMRLYRRRLRDAHNIFEVLSDRDFKKSFRFSKELAHLLIDQLEPHLITQRSTSIPAYLKILITLHFLGHGSYQHRVGLPAVMAMSQTSVSRAIQSVCTIITRFLMPEWIRFPTNINEKNDIKQGFFDKFGFRGVTGYIDGTHVAIVALPLTDEVHPPHVYVNRKGYHSINVTLICDSNCKIIFCDARYPGSVHDAAIWRMSDARNYLRTQYDNGDINTRLVGDSGYGLEPWLFTPFGRTVPNSPEANFNRLLTTTRNCIERTNGVLKGRFRALLKHRVLHYSPDKAAYLIYSAAVLHNIALRAGLPIEEDNVVLEDDDGPQQNDAGEHGIDNNILELGRASRAEYIRLNNL